MACCGKSGVHPAHRTAVTVTIHEHNDILLNAGSCSPLEHYFMDIGVLCPYGLKKKAVYHQAQFTALPDDIFEQFLDRGYRRNGNYVYCMRCPDCADCVPIRLRPDQFRPSRSQRRNLVRNRDLTAGLSPLSMSRENLDLLEKFLEARFPESKSSAIGYYSGFFLGSLTRSFEIRYRLKDKLIGVSIIDCSSRWINAVYFYFDPDFSHRGPGTYNILYLIDFCRQHGIDMLYLGYCIGQVQAMSYKSRFNPHQLFFDGKWQEVVR